MAELPIYATYLANIRGPKGETGEKGRPGTFDSASAVSVAPEDPVEAIISGPEGENVEFRIPRGQPGVNAVPADEAVGTYVATQDSQSRAAVRAAVDEDGATAFADPSSALSVATAARYPVYRLWDEQTSSYPARVPGAFNIFFGPTDPGLYMDPVDDRWEPGDGTSLATVVANAENPSSDLGRAIQGAATPTRVWRTAGQLAASDERPPRLAHYADGNSTASMPTWFFDSGSTVVIADVLSVPTSWRSADVRILWSIRTTTLSGNVTWGVNAHTVEGGSSLSLPGTAVTVTDGIPQTRVIRSTLLPNAVTIEEGQDLVRVNIYRTGASDTYAGAAGLIGYYLERAS